MDMVREMDEFTPITHCLESELKQKILHEQDEQHRRQKNVFFNVNKMEYGLNNKTRSVINVTTNEVAPGELNSIQRITQLLNLNINSCFRHNYFQSNPSDFLFTLPVEIKHVLSVRLVSIEIPNSWYLFSSKKKNNSFHIQIHSNNPPDCETDQQFTIEIPEGNYNFEQLEQYLNCTYFCDSDIDYPLNKLRFSIHPNSLKSSFEFVNCEHYAENFTFSVLFSSAQQSIVNTAGWILGFRLANYFQLSAKLVSEGLFDAGGDRYVYLCLNDFQYNNNTSNIVCFDANVLNEDVIAKIPMENGKLSLVVNDNNNSLAKIRRYNGPVNLQKMQIKLLDQYGSVIDLNNMDFSMTLELQILYENFNFSNVTA
jgi:hypothetical protein